MTNGPGETLVTVTRRQVKTSVLASVPGATVIRLETDSGGGEHEAHLAKADGSEVMALLDTSFKVADTAEGFGGRGHHDGDRDRHDDDRP